MTKTTATALLNDAIEHLYNKALSEELSAASWCECIRELLPSKFAGRSISDRAILAATRKLIPASGR